ncbi:malic enzyme-like NAD(P)-binding protein [Abyssibacter profundi]|uniref:NADP-dependent malic enzyme n=1 Tax=Abyssibacter profundi TaxID=2182787 RepID=A0A383XRD6_9GAMM|nr:malic enzyme-like NAD(P)-binding protein [Abyssibacter profundi]MBV61446.1 malate dehydrogenase [Nevskiales bacterium]PWN55190.1 malate dehydrogenase [Abyssibacter profundi]
MSNPDRRQAALDYHAKPRPGKLGIAITKPFTTPSELALAYSPGVAEPVIEIEKNPDDAFKYTSKGNLVAVITNGTAVLGLGRTGALASKPVMEGKAVLFKKFANVDVFDIEVDAPDADDFIETVKRIAPTFGGINLEDIAAPDCFYVEQALSDALDIPVFHDDQHGTAIIICAGLLNALSYQGKTLEQARIVCVGAGAAGIASMNLLQALGADANNIIMCDSKGVVHSGRTDLNAQKQAFAVDTDLRTLEDAMSGADVFIGVSGPGLVSQAMVQSMAPKPVVFALANPTPEILPEEAHAVRDDLIMATGRSDYPNQVNNVLCFPFLFRGALDVRSRSINHAMQIAAVHAIADLARQPVPEVVKDAYDAPELSFGPEYILPTPLDPRLSDFVSPAVAAAAVDSGAARSEYPAHYPKR